MKMGGKGGGSEASQSSFLGKKDPFNLSNDEFYNPRHVTSTQGLSGLDSTVVQHSLPTLDMHPAWFPTHLSLHSLRNFHRPRLRLRCDSRRSTTGFISVEGLREHIARKARASLHDCVFQYSSVSWIDRDGISLPVSGAREGEGEQWRRRGVLHADSGGRECV